MAAFVDSRQPMRSAYLVTYSAGSISEITHRLMGTKSCHRAILVPLICTESELRMASLPPQPTLLSTEQLLDEAKTYFKKSLQSFDYVLPTPKLTTGGTKLPASELTLYPDG